MSFDGGAVTTLMGNVFRVLNLLWIWNYCCKLEIVCADSIPFLVTKGFDALIIDGELLISFLWDLITQRLGTIISTTMPDP